MHIEGVAARDRGVIVDSASTGVNGLDRNI
jgi:hypothetical protein